MSIDPHSENAAKLFEVAAADITKKQRRVAKAWMHAANYSAGQIKQGLIVGQYPIKFNGECDAENT